MRKFFLLAGLLAAVPAAAQETLADLDTSVRCAALFGFVAGGQERGLAVATEFPPLAQRGREFFVQTGARLIDERGLTREQIEQRFRAATTQMFAEQRAAPDSIVVLRSQMAPCLILLDATVPTTAGRVP